MAPKQSNKLKTWSGKWRIKGANYDEEERSTRQMGDTRLKVERDLVSEEDMYSNRNYLSPVALKRKE